MDESDGLTFPPPQQEVLPIPPPVLPSTPVIQSTPVVIPASQNKRFLNFLIDYYIVFLTAEILIFTADIFNLLPPQINYIGSLIYVLLYYAAFEYFFHKTPGKFITKTRVVSQTGGSPGLLAVSLRTICRFIPFEWFSFLSLNPRGWHDKLSHTYVVGDTDQAPMKRGVLAEILIMMGEYVGLAVVFVLLGLAIFSGFSHFIHPTVSAPAVEKTIQKQQATYNQPITSWKEYTNDKYGFSFKYPPNVTMDPHFPYGVLFPSPSQMLFNKIFGDENTYKINKQLFVSGVDTGIRYNGFEVFVFTGQDETLNQAADMYRNTAIAGYEENSTITVNPIMQPAEVGNLPAVHIFNFGTFPANIYLVKLADGNVLGINQLEESKGSFSDTFQKILSTFTIITPSAITVTLTP